MNTLYIGIHLYVHLATQLMEDFLMQIYFFCKDLNKEG